MSGKAVGWAMEQRTGSPTTKLVLVKLADNANEWKAWPSVTFIAEDTELSERAVREHLRKLEELGLIRGEKRFQDGVQLPTIYLLLADSWIPRKAGQRIPKIKKGGDHCAPPRQDSDIGHEMPDGGAREAPRVGHEVQTNPYREPLEEPLLSPASPPVSEIASLGKGNTERWPEFRSAVAKTWPKGFPAADEIACSRAFEAATRRHPPDLVIACANLHGAVLTRQASERRAPGPLLVKKPSNWLKEREWEGYIPQAETEAETGSAESVTLIRVRATLGAEVVEKLKNTGITDAELAKLDGVEFTDDPAPRFIAPPWPASRLRQRASALQREFGKDLTIIEIAERRSA